MKIHFLYTGSKGFPIGDAYTNRILSLAKGFINIGCKIKILIIYPGRNIGVNEKEGLFDNIPYKYMTPFKLPKNNIQRKLWGIIGILATIRFFLSKKIDSDVIICFSESYFQNRLISLVTYIKNIFFIREINEYPKAVLKKGLDGLNNYDIFLIKETNACSNALLSISTGIKEFLNQYLKDLPILVVPIVVDLERFNNLSKYSRISNYITYCGDLFGEKDGIEILIQAFAQISDNYPEIQLLLIGSTDNNKDYDSLRNKLRNLKIDNRVVFTGYIPRIKIPQLLIKSKVLVLARPDNVQAKGGFPTKLGEYLATGKPVLVTSVGDIPIYIKDKKNGFLAEPGSVKSFAAKLQEILMDYSKAEKIGIQGKKLAEEIFNPVVQSKEIVEFINHLKQ